MNISPNHILLAEGSNSKIYLHSNPKLIIKKIIGNNTNEIQFLQLIKDRDLKHSLIPEEIDVKNKIIIMRKMTPLSDLPYHRLNKNDKSFIIQSINNCIQELHNNGILHNDIKLDNFLYDPITLEVKLIDFSSSSFITEKTLNNRTTPQYKSPDLYYSTDTDLWSLSICIRKLTKNKILNLNLI